MPIEGIPEEAAATGWWEAPVLTGALVRLEPLSPAHADGLLAAADDDAVFAHLRDERPQCRADAVRLVEGILALRAKGWRVPWAQVALDDRRGDVVVGTTSYWFPDPSMRTVEIGSTWIGRRWWRTGVNTEAKALLLRRAFEDLGAVRVTWQADIRNERSQTAIASLGARREGVLRKNRKRKGGEWRDSVLFAMTDDDWPKARERLAARVAAHRAGR